MAQTVVLMFLMTLTFDLCSIGYHIKKAWNLRAGISVRSLIRIRHVLMGDMATVKLKKKHPMLCNGIFRCHGNICYATFIDVCFCNVHTHCPESRFLCSGTQGWIPSMLRVDSEQWQQAVLTNHFC